MQEDKERGGMIGFRSMLQKPKYLLEYEETHLPHHEDHQYTCSPGHGFQSQRNGTDRPTLGPFPHSVNLSLHLHDDVFKKSFKKKYSLIIQTKPSGIWKHFQDLHLPLTILRWL